MQRPAIMKLAPGVDRRLLGLGLVGLLTFTVGFVGQGSWGVGAATPSSVGAVVTDVVGGVGSRKPVRVKISMAVTNSGPESVRVVGPDSNGTGVRMLALSPADLIIEPRAIGWIDADVTLDCERPEPLQLPDLRLELPDGVRRAFRIGGSGMLLEACSRAAPAVRPLIATIPTAPATTPSPSGTSEDRLTVLLSSPTGRRSDVRAIRAGGAVLPMSPTTVTVAGPTPVAVHLTAPRPCPVQWQITGIPSALTIDLAPAPKPPEKPSSATQLGSSSEFGATLRLRLGPALTSWLLATSCPEAP